MKFTILREEFLKPLQLVVGVVERRQTLPILSHVLISLDELGQLSLTGTDLEVEIVGKVALDMHDNEPGEITVPARKLMDICRSLPEEAVLEISSKDDRTVLTSKRSRFTLSSLPASEFPSVDDSPGQVEFSMPAQALKQLIDSTAFAMAHQDVRYYLNGMLWEANSGSLNTVATDGHRLAMSTREMPVSVPNKVQIIIPRKGVLELSKMLIDGKEVTVVLGSNHVRVLGPDFRFTSKLVDGAYPDYERVLPRGGTKIVAADRESLRQAFVRTAILSNEKYRGVRLLLENGSLKMVANNPEQEQAEEEVSVEYHGDSLEIGFNVSYILDVLNVLKGDTIRFVLSDANSSALIEDPRNSESVYVIMPMRL